MVSLPRRPILRRRDDQQRRRRFQNISPTRPRISPTRTKHFADASRNFTADVVTLPMRPVTDGRTVDIVQHLKFLGSTISSNLKWVLNVVNIVKKAQQRLYFLRRLRSFGLTTQVMFNFYRSVIESVLIFSFTVSQYGLGRLHRRNRSD